MIRRDPTMIPMTDSDLQEIRAKLDEKRRMLTVQHAQEPKRRPPPGFAKEAEAQQKREAMSKNERLGL